MHLYSPKWYSEAPIDLIWKYSSLWVILGVFDKKKLILSPKLVKNTTEKGQNQENQEIGGSQFNQNWMGFWPNCLKMTPELPQNEKNGGMAQQAK